MYSPETSSGQPAITHAPQVVLDESVDYPLPGYSDQLREGLLMYYCRDNYLHDAYITTAGRHVLSAHRIVLASCSPILHNIFSVIPEVKRLLLEEFAYNDVKIVIDAMYTGMLRLSRGNLQYVKAIVQKLDITPMIALCEQFIPGHTDLSCPPPEVVPSYGHAILDEPPRVNTTPTLVEITPTCMNEQPPSSTKLEDVHIKTEVEGSCGLNEQPPACTRLEDVHIKTEVEGSCGLKIKVSNSVEAIKGDRTPAVDVLVPPPVIKEERPCTETINTPNLLSQMDALAYLLNSCGTPEQTDTETRVTTPTIVQSAQSLTKATDGGWEQYYECKICGKKFPFYSNLKLHYRKHSGGMYALNPRHRKQTKSCVFKMGQGYCCVLCLSAFRLHVMVLRHVRDSHFRRARCKECGFRFVSYRRLQDHRYAKHKERIKISPNSSCLRCCKVFRHQSNADKHTPCTSNTDWSASFMLAPTALMSPMVTASHSVCPHCKQKFRHPRLLQRHTDHCLLQDSIKIKMEDSIESKNLHRGLTIDDDTNDVAATMPVNPKSHTQRKAQNLKPNSEDELFEQNILGDDSPLQLLRTMIYMVDTYFSKLKAKTIIYREQISIFVDEHGSFVTFREARLTRTGTLKFGKHSDVKLYEKKSNPQRCFVHLVTNYLNHCPTLHDFLSPFFLVAKKESGPCYWYMQRKQGTCTIHRMLKKVLEEQRQISASLSQVPASSAKPHLARPVMGNTSKSGMSDSRYIKIAPASGALGGASVDNQTNTPNQSTDSVIQSQRTYSQQSLPEVLASSKCTQVGKFIIFYSPEISYRNLNIWLKKDKSQCETDLQVANKLRIENSGGVDDLAPCQLYFVLKYLLLQGKVFGNFGSSNYSRVLRHTPALTRALEYIIEQYMLKGKSKGYVFEKTNIQMMLTTKTDKWYPYPVLPPLVKLVEQGMLGDKEPEVLLRSVLFLMIVTFQLTLAELHALTRSMVVIDEDERGRYLCYCKDMSASLNHAYVHEYAEGDAKGLVARLFINDKALFTNAPLRIYAKADTPQFCLVHLMSLYLTKSLPLEKILFCQPSRLPVWSKYWYKQQAVGRNWICKAVEKILNTAGMGFRTSRDLMLDLIHCHAIEHGHPKIEPCKKCSHYTRDT